jgi:hypothetical protein
MQREIGFALFCLLVFLLSGPGVITQVDGVVHYAVARSLVDHGTFAINANDPALLNNPTPVPGKDGRTYAQYNLGLALLIAPLYALGELLSGALPHVGGFTAADFLVSMTNALVTAATAWLVVLFVLEFGFGRRAALLAGTGFAFGSMAWTYATTLFTEPATGFCVLLSALLLVRSRRSPQPAALVLGAGLAAGGALFMRVPAGVFVPGLGLYLLLTHRRAGWRLAGLLAAFGVGVAVFVGATGWYNFARFGSPLETGYTLGASHNELLLGMADTASGRGLDQIAYALYALVFSPGRGLLLYAPVLILGLLGLPTLARRWPLEAGLLVVLSGSLLITEAVLPFDYWFSGWSYGPRYLLPIVGLGAVSAGAWYANASRRSSVGWLAGAALAAIIVMQLPSVLTRIDTVYHRATVERGDYLDRAYLTNSWQAIYVGGWRELARLTERTLSGQPVPHGRLSEMPDSATALEQAETLNTFQPWWLHLAQSGRLGGAAELGMLVLVGLLVIGAALTLRALLGARAQPDRACAPAPDPALPLLAGSGPRVPPQLVRPGASGRGSA